MSENALLDAKLTGFAYKVLHADGSQIDPTVPPGIWPIPKLEVHDLKLEAIDDAILDAD
ncbi:MAG: hypothetical protein ABSA13_08055 [Beijerinckiaceae bacterium]|jgi:hypothetical protein